MSIALTEIARAFISRGVILHSEDADAIKGLDASQQRELYATLQDLPESDFLRVKGDVARFVRLFEKYDKETFYSLKAILASEYGRAFFEDTIGHYEKATDEQIAQASRSSATEKPVAQQSADTHPDWEIMFSYEEFEKKRTYPDFVQFYRNRHKQLSQILKGRYELRDALPARRILAQDGRETIAFIGIVTEKRETKNGNIVISAEDPTGVLTLIAHNSKPEVIEAARDLVPDEVVGFRGMRSGDAVFLDDIIWPDVPVDAPMHYAEEDVGAVFISDVQYGRQFLHHEFNEFITWISGESKDEHAELAKNVRYLFLVGDVVDGIGIFPSQQEELDVKELYAQFDHVAEYLKHIPKHITIFICAGNHDPIRLAEPQPLLPADFAKPLYDLDNVVMVTNPSIIKIGKTRTGAGIEVLLYHGYSFDYYAQNVDSIREAGGYDAPIEIMRYLLKRRHLAPTHASTLFIPDIRKDYHVIERVPDIFATGHLHRMEAGTYRSTTLLQCGGWMGKTPFEEKLGHNPNPGKAFHVNLKTRKVSQIDFITPERERILKEKNWL